MDKCAVVASISSRKSMAIAKSIKGLLNIKIVGVAHSIHPHLFSGIFDYRYLYKVRREGVDWPYIVAMVAHKHGCDVVVPVDYIDFVGFSKYAKIFYELGITVAAPRYEDIVLASDRVRIVDKLGKAVAFPKQVFVGSSHDAESIYGLSPPLVVKNLGDASNPSFHLDSESAVSEAVRRIPCVVQEYVEGIGRGYYALAFEGKPIVEFTHQRIVEYQPVGGASLCAKGPVEDPQLYAIGRKVVELLRWNGVLMVETRYVDELGVYYVIEVNPKFWGSIDLAVSLGYHFPGILVAAYIYGEESARELAKRLKVHGGEFVWVLDGLRYLAKIPSVWIYMARKMVANPLRSDVDLLEPAKNLMQILKALERFSRERDSWRAYLEGSRIELVYWLKRFTQFLESRRRVVIFDLDATLTQLPVDWRRVRQKLVELGLVKEWETINRAMVRLWSSDKKGFETLSSIIEEAELSSLNKLSKNDLYASRQALKQLSEEATICIATKQSMKVAKAVLNKLGVSEFVYKVIGRDGNAGPIKIAMYFNCLEGFDDAKAVVIDDNIEYIVEAYRKGFASMLASDNVYRIARIYRLGIPAAPTKNIVDFVLHSLRSLKQ
ncbi:MAG: hypothetical protein QW348_01250 [Ignisphaera sp.]